MILLILILLALVTTYYARLLFKKGMWFASAATVVLFGAVLGWVYTLFFIDAGGLGLTGADMALPIDELALKMPEFAVPAFKAIVIVIVFTVLAAVVLVIHGCCSITKAVIEYFKSEKKLSHYGAPKKGISFDIFNVFESDIFKLNCRLNC
ncbi:MAG: hypothetical protein IJS71_07535 [Clostridia bacterium]|nr:hypothetical protein [Clostridia bacterium]